MMLVVAGRRGPCSDGDGRRHANAGQCTGAAPCAAHGALRCGRRQPWNPNDIIQPLVLLAGSRSAVANGTVPYGDRKPVDSDDDDDEEEEEEDDVNVDTRCVYGGEASRWGRAGHHETSCWQRSAPSHSVCSGVPVWRSYGEQNDNFAASVFRANPGAWGNEDFASPTGLLDGDDDMVGDEDDEYRSSDDDDAHDLPPELVGDVNRRNHILLTKLLDLDSPCITPTMRDYLCDTAVLQTFMSHISRTQNSGITSSCQSDLQRDALRLRTSCDDTAQHRSYRAAQLLASMSPAMRSVIDGRISVLGTSPAACASRPMALT